MAIENIQDTWDVVKDRPIGEYLNYLNDRSKNDPDSAVIYAAASLGVYYFAKHITGEEDAED